MTNALTERDPPPASAVNAVVVQQTMDVLTTIRDFAARQMKDGLDYGVIPGTGGKDRAPKKTLLLPGAQKVCMLYNCYPEYDIETTELGSGHADFRVMTKLVSRSTNTVVGSGIGSCSTMESKYRWRTAKRVCPSCGAGTIIKTTKGRNPGGYWCVPDKGGCNANFNPGDPSVENQELGKVENPDIYDVRNTVLKMAKKRSLVDASLGLGCLAELFTQDLDEEAEGHEDDAPPPRPKETNGHGLPADGRALYQRLKAKADALVAEGFAAAKDLPGHVARVGKSKGFPNLTEYSAEQIKWAAQETGDYIKRLRADAEPIHADAAADLADLAAKCSEDQGDLMAYIGLPRETAWDALTVAQHRVLKTKLDDALAKQAAV